MSNASVGNIYNQIINEVIEASRVDFEDQGVGEEVLEELRKVCSFFPLSFPTYVKHTQAHIHKPSGCRRRLHLICSYETTAFFHLPRAPCIPCIEVGVGLGLRRSCLLPCRLAGSCWLAVLAAWAGCSQRRCRRWPVARIAGQRAKKGGRLGVRSDRRVTGCYLGLLSSTPARKIAFATPVNPPLHFNWSQLCPPSRAPKHDTRRG